MTTTSRVRDTRKPITSRSGVNQAHKTLDTLATAAAILRASGDDTASDALTPAIARLGREIRSYYANLDLGCRTHGIARCTICTPAGVA